MARAKAGGLLQLGFVAAGCGGRRLALRLRLFQHRHDDQRTHVVTRNIVFRAGSVGRVKFVCNGFYPSARVFTFEHLHGCPGMIVEIACL